MDAPPAASLSFISLCQIDPYSLAVQSTVLRSFGPRAALASILLRDLKPWAARSLTRSSQGQFALVDPESDAERSEAREQPLTRFGKEELRRKGEKDVRKYGDEQGAIGPRFFRPRDAAFYICAGRSSKPKSGPGGSGAAETRRKSGGLSELRSR